MLWSENVFSNLKNSKSFFEGYNTLTTGCRCEKCRISRYRHTHEPHLADAQHSFWEYLNYCIDQVQTDGLWLEFGVGGGRTIEFIAARKPNTIIYGFDSFEGLPEDWKISDSVTYPQNKYSRSGEAPQLTQPNIRLVKGYFSDTLDAFLAEHAAPCAFIHIDCDLYSSTIEILNTLHRYDRISSGTVILFDEFYNYHYYQEHEFKAFLEFVTTTQLNYEWIAHTSSPVEWNGNQAALMVR